MIRCFLLNAAVLTVAIATWFYYQNTQKQLLVSINQVRDARVQLQHTEQQLYRLEKDASKPLLTVLGEDVTTCLLYTSPSPRDRTRSRMPSSA